jgi:hypothetical protein
VPPVVVPPAPEPEPTATTEVKGEQATENETKDQTKDKGEPKADDKAETPVVEVLGAQATLPTQVAAGLSGDVSQASSSSSLWLAGMTGLLAVAIGLGLLSARRLRGRA